MSNYSTNSLCPSGFVIPDDNSKFHASRIHYISGSGCSLSCRRPGVLSGKEYRDADRTMTISSIFGLIVSCATLYIWYTSWDKKDVNNRGLLKKQPLTTVWILTSILLTISLLLTATVITPPAVNNEEKLKYLCEGNAVSRSISDGHSLCAAQSVLWTFSSLAFCVTWVSQSVELHSKVIYGIHVARQYLWFYVVTIIGYPILAVAILGSYNALGYDGTNSFCGTRSSSYTTTAAHNNSGGKRGVSVETLLYDIPLIIATSIGFILQLRVFIAFLRLKLRKKVQPLNMSRRPSQTQLSAADQQQRTATGGAASGNNNNNNNNTFMGRFFLGTNGGGQPPRERPHHFSNVSSSGVFHFDFTTMAGGPAPRRVSRSSGGGGSGSGRVAPSVGGLDMSSVLGDMSRPIHRSSSNQGINVLAGDPVIAAGGGGGGSSARSMSPRGGPPPSNNAIFQNQGSPGSSGGILSLGMPQRFSPRRNSKKKGGGGGGGVSGQNSKQNSSVQNSEGDDPSSVLSIRQSSMAEQIMGIPVLGAGSGVGSSGSRRRRSSTAPATAGDIVAIPSASVDLLNDTNRQIAAAAVVAVPVVPPVVVPVVPPAPFFTFSYDFWLGPKGIITASFSLLVNCLAYVIIWSVFFSYRLERIMSQSTESYTSGFNEWSQCVLTHYDGFTDSSWITPCGEVFHSHYSPSASMHIVYILICGLGFPLVMVAVLYPGFRRKEKTKKERLPREYVRIMEIRQERQQQRELEREQLERERERERDRIRERERERVDRERVELARRALRKRQQQQQQQQQRSNPPRDAGDSEDHTGGTSNHTNKAGAGGGGAGSAGRQLMST